MTDAVIEVLEKARELSADDRRLLREQLEADAAMAEVPPEIIDDELREVEARMAAYDANPTPHIPWEEAKARILAKLAAGRGGS